MAKISYHNTVIDLQNGTGKKATVAVYKIGTNELATIYSSIDGAGRTNPFQTDDYGRFSFFIDPGNYDIQISGKEILPYKLEGVTFTGFSSAPGNAYVVKNIYVNSDNGRMVVEYEVP
jgi:hypothetical protein